MPVTVLCSLCGGNAETTVSDNPTTRGLTIVARCHGETRRMDLDRDVLDDIRAGTARIVSAVAFECGALVPAGEDRP